jgi:hypothetical protein
MPAVGERKTKGGVTGEWDGTTWRRVDAAASDQPAGPKVGDRKTKNGITGEWDGTTWRQVDVTGEPESTPDKPSGAGAMAAGGALAALSAGVPALRGAAERIATAPSLGSTAGALAARLAAPLNVGKQVYDVATGKQSAVDAGKDALLGEGARRFFRPERIVRAGAQPLGPKGWPGWPLPWPCRWRAGWPV